MDQIQFVGPENMVPKRKRAFAHKSATGCMTCRIRRIKCDEVRPACSQCQRGRRTCDGYNHVTPHRFANTQRQTGTKHNLPVRLRSSISTSVFETSAESNHFSFFFHKTLTRLCQPFASEFWSRSILQAVYREPPIRYAIIALAALHQEYINHDQWDEKLLQKDSCVALKYYLKAIQSLVDPSSARGSLSTDVALMACVLFICYEVLRGFHDAALAHIESGIKLHSQLQSSNYGIGTSPRYTSLQVFTWLMARLDQQASSITHHRSRHLLSTPLSPCEKAVPEPDILCFMMKPFESLEEVRSALAKIQNAALRRTSSLIDPTLIVDYTELDTTQLEVASRPGYSVLRMRQWRERFDEYLQTHPVRDFASRKAIQILFMHSIIMDINFRIDFALARYDEMQWDIFEPQFHDIVRHARLFMQIEALEADDGPVFTLDTEIILPLYFVATKCRYRTLRSEAIQILLSRKRQEGVWSAATTATLCLKLVQIEERNAGCAKVSGVLPEHIRNEHRIKVAELRWDTDRSSVKMLFKGHASGNESVGQLQQQEMRML